ncbi:MAG: hypothetical protein Kow0037_23860 [Calditrichia bacterium]
MSTSVKKCPEDKPVISPEMKVSEFLEAYPELESVLIEITPAFEKLKNPLLRRTIARVTKLKQAAEIAGIPVAEIVNKLRKAAGQDEWRETGSEAAAATSPESAEWREMQVFRTLDARPMLEAGEHPVQQVMREIEELPEGQRYELITPFLPTPLLDMAKSKGFKTASEEPAAGEFHNYIYR